MENCCLDNNTLCRFLDFRVIASHDTGNTNRFPLCRNDNIILFNLIAFPIQCCIGKSLLILYRDFLCRNRINIIEMQWLACFQHNDITDIDHIVDRLHTGCH